jgi:hypothetical protein
MCKGVDDECAARPANLARAEDAAAGRTPHRDDTFFPQFYLVGLP